MPGAQTILRTVRSSDTYSVVNSARVAGRAALDLVATVECPLEDVAHGEHRRRLVQRGAALGHQPVDVEHADQTTTSVSRCFITLPVALRGSSSTKCTTRGRR